MAQVISIVLFIIGLVLIIISSKKERYNSWYHLL
jgi:prolipoprotein diacylglyceryltransferase